MASLEPYVPYKGNKFQIVENIYNSIVSSCPASIRGFVDAFTGGGSFAYFAASHNYPVLANDIDSSVIALHRACKDCPLEIEGWAKIPYTKSGFKAILADETAKGALIRSLWSFSNDGRTYLTSTENEQNKIEQFLRGEAEPNSRYKHVEDIILLQVQRKLDLTFVCGSYEELQIPENFVVYCFTPDHDVLTKRGWIPISELTESDYLLSREPNTGILEYVKNTRVIKREYQGMLYTYESRTMSLAVSPEHKLFVHRLRGREKRKSDEFIQAKDAHKHAFSWISAGGKWEVAITPFYLNGVQIDKRKFARLLGLFLTDGCVNSRDHVTISQKKPKIMRLLRQLLQDLGIKYSEYKNGTFYIHAEYAKYFTPFGRKETRRIPDEFKNADKETLRALLEGILDGDSDNERRKIYIGSKTLADDIMEVAYKAGFAAAIRTAPPKRAYLKTEKRWIIGTRPYYIISLLHNNYKSHVNKYDGQMWYDGMLYCCTLEKWHTILVRRKGKCIWCGQCDPPYSNSSGYRVGGFDHDKFYRWCLEQPGYVYISEYSMPDEFTLVDEYFKWVESGRGARTKAGVERLYCNKPVKKLSLF